jgi:hypothetical protein
VTEIEEGVIVDAAAELLKAAMLLMDLMGAMPIKIQIAMPPDLLNRCMSHGYQSAFDALPAEIRARARAQALADPDVQDARRIDAQVREQGES